MNWFTKLFGNESATTPQATPPSSGKVTAKAAGLTQGKKNESNHWKNTSPGSFVSQAMTGAAYCRMPISQTPATVVGLSEKLMTKGVSSDRMTQFLHDTLFGICPECQQSCSGGLLLTVGVMSNVGSDNITWNTDISGGGPKQRLMRGQCGNAGCSNRRHYELFFCADLNQEMLRHIDATYHLTYRPDNVGNRPQFLRPS
jgi:hypothetical protein